jgi:DNA-binding beta-propeller fold protein YncE
MAIEHAGHKYDRIEKVAEKEKVHLVSLLRRADDAKAKLDGAISKGRKVVRQVQAKQDVVEKDIKSAFKVLNKALTTREQALLAKAGEISLGKQTALTMQGEQLQLLRKEIIETSEMISAATKAYTPAEMLSAKGAMAKKLEHLLKQYHVASLEPCKSDAIPSMLGTREVVTHINSFGMVAGGSFPGEAKTDLYICRATEGKQRKVVITACDISGKPFPHGGERVDATLSLLGSQDPSCSTVAKVLDNKGGTYVASFTPQRIGEHELSITIDGNHIKGSPFPLYVRQETNYRSLSTTQNCFTLSGIPQDVAVEDNEVYVVVCGQSMCIEVFNQNWQRIRNIGYANTQYNMSHLHVKRLTIVDMPNEYGMPDEGAENVHFYNPVAVAIRGGVLYVVDSGQHCVQKITNLGKFISKFGSNGSGNGQLSNPRGICLDNAGRVFVSDCGNNRISVFEADGSFLYHISGNTADRSNLNGPWGLAFDQCGNLHVADTNTNTIKVFTPQGQYTSQYSSGVNQPSGIAIDEEGNIFIVDSGYRYNTYASYSMAVGGGYQNRTRGQTSQPNQVCLLNSKHTIIHYFGANQAGTGITIDKEGSIYVCSSNNYQLHKY